MAGLSANGHGAQQPVPMLLQPQPLPFQALIDHAPDGRGGQILTLTLVGPWGATKVFLPPEGAKTLAADLVRHAQAAGAGLVLP